MRMKETSITMIPSKVSRPAKFFYLCIIITLVLPTTTIAQPRLASYCYDIDRDTGDYTTNSTYQSNLNTLLPSLSTNASLNSGFSTASVGKTPDRINGLALCRGDTAAPTCRDCLNMAVDQIMADCPNKKAAVIWYDKCLLRYTNLNYFFASTETFRFSQYNGANLTDPARFTTVVGDLMARLVDEAVQDPSNRLFATGEAVIDSLQTVYGLVQCTRDLSSTDCNTCLRDLNDAVSSSVGGRGGWILSRSCNFMYGMDRFYNVSKLAVAPSPSPILNAPSPAPVLDAPSRNASPPPILDAPSRNSTTANEKRSPSRLAWIVIVIVIIAAAVVGAIIWACSRRKKPRQTRRKISLGRKQAGSKDGEYALYAIITATNNFAEHNKLGGGGFGPVYKGVLPDGTEIAVKRLSRGSQQGEKEFLNEVAIVVKLQHNNLVTLMGYCAEGGEMILVYEYVPNKSLDYFLFDQSRKAQLEWETRCNVIQGIARGLLYLHEDSRLKIVHRDLKPSNVLLDSKMNAKIADFGMAKTFVVDQSRGHTRQIAGTYGYMAPEYAVNGNFSFKSDVFSFGVILLEILTGIKRSSFHQSETMDLLCHAWNLWSSGAVMEIIDPSVRGSCKEAEAMRYVHIAFLCLQEHAEARPPMSNVNLMLNGNYVNLPTPMPPAFVGGMRSDGVIPTHVSINEVTMTELDPR